MDEDIDLFRRRASTCKLHLDIESDYFRVETNSVVLFLPQVLYSVLKWRVYESSYCLEDYREAHRIPPSARMFLPLRKRLYGVLLKESPDGASVVQEWCMAGQESLDAAENVSISETPGASSSVY